MLSNSGSSIHQNGNIKINPHKLYTVEVTEHDSSSATPLSASDALFLQISCTTCISAHQLEGKMIYLDQSKFGYNFSLDFEGEIALSVILRNPGRVVWQFFGNEELKLPVASVSESDTLDNIWPGTDNTSVRVSTYLRPEISGVYTFYVSNSGGANVWMNGVQYESDLGQPGVFDQQIVLQLEVGNQYLIQVEQAFNGTQGYLQSKFCIF